MPGYAVSESMQAGFPALAVEGPPGALSATFVPSLAMLCSSVRLDGAELLDPRAGVEAYATTGSTCGIPLLHPWANRVSERRFAVPGTGREIDLRDESLFKVEENGLPIHGVLPALLPFAVTSAAAGEETADVHAEIDTERAPRLLEAFPFPHRLRIEIRLRGLKLTVRTHLAATGDVPVPMTFGYHPYLRLPAPRARCRALIPAGTRLVLDERTLPTGEAVPNDLTDVALAGASLDDAFGDIPPGAPFAAAASDGSGADVRMGRGYPWAQVFSPAEAGFTCFEPMTSPANALVTGRGLALVRPGREAMAGFAVSWSLPRSGEPGSPAR
jgi:aldose 1-epimerase